MNHSSMVLEDMNIDFNCKVVSNLGVIPDDLDDFGVVAYPTAIFIDKSTICGAYSNISDLETFNDALNMFLSEEQNGEMLNYRRDLVEKVDKNNYKEINIQRGLLMQQLDSDMLEKVQ